MKNLKNITTAIALAAVLMVGTASANTQLGTEITTQDTQKLTRCTVIDTNVIKGFIGKFIKQIVVNMPRAFFVPQIVFDNETQNCDKNDSISAYGKRHA